MDENTSAIVFWREVSANGRAFLDTTDKMRYCLREMGKISAGSCEIIVTSLIVNLYQNQQLMNMAHPRTVAMQHCKLKYIE